MTGGTDATSMRLAMSLIPLLYAVLRITCVGGNGDGVHPAAQIGPARHPSGNRGRSSPCQTVPHGLSRATTLGGRVPLKLRTVHYVWNRTIRPNRWIARGAEADRRRPCRYGRVQPPHWVG